MKKWFRIKFSLNLILVFCPFSTDALAQCGWNRDRTFYSCDQFGFRNTLGQGLPLMGDTIQNNPAALPTVSTPIWVEAITSSKTAGPLVRKQEASLLKGFDGLGFGLGTRSPESFSGPTISENYDGTANYTAYKNAMNEAPNYGFNFGNAFLIPTGPLQSLARITGGVMIGKGGLSDRFSYGFGTVFNFGIFYLGYAKKDESPSRGVTDVVSNQYNIGLQLNSFVLGAVRTDTKIGVASARSELISIRWTADTWSIFGAQKFYKNYLNELKSEHMASVEFAFSSRINLGYAYGVYPGAHSLLGRLSF